MTTSLQVRQSLVDALAIDLVGPDAQSSNINEILPIAPSRWYLTGFLVPKNAEAEQKSDPTAEEDLAVQDARASAGDDDDAPEVAPKRRVAFPTSIGLSVLLPAAAKELRAKISWGDYQRLLVDPEDQEDAEEVDVGDVEKEPEDAKKKATKNRRLREWHRTPCEEEVTLKLSTEGSDHEIANSKNMRVLLRARRFQEPDFLDKAVYSNAWSVSVFVVNDREPASTVKKDEAFAFQVSLELFSAEGFLHRPDLKGFESDDLDERVANLQFRDVREYAVGHGVSSVSIEKDGRCDCVRTTWLPISEVEQVVPNEKFPSESLEMERLASIQSGTEAKTILGSFPEKYRHWIKAESNASAQLHANQKATAEHLINECERVCKRIEKGIALLSNEQIRKAFCLANKTMAMAARQREIQKGNLPENASAPKWRPFQLAFVLLNLDGIANPESDERESADLLFFPTGGGKTEAYLGLAAFTLVLRRLKNPGTSGYGVAILMRYTLRLLTLDQLGRATALMCALEMERKQNTKELGDWPFEMGLWVGRGGTPNRMGESGDGDENSAYAKAVAYKNDSTRPRPIPIENCPWCGEAIPSNGFVFLPAESKRPDDLRVCCRNPKCEFHNQHLPLVAVDETLYRRLPCFIIATVDKFAALPWVGESGALFGRVTHFNPAKGFLRGDLGNAGVYRPLPEKEKPLPPELVIQDELHLISGPLGSMVGLYETAIDALSSRTLDGKTIRPKIVASTATIRRAAHQISSLFGRKSQMTVFPPPGPNRKDSFFAFTTSADKKPARMYVGVAAQGRSAKVVMLRTYLALLSAGQHQYNQTEKEGERNPADGYMTLLGYFNSLRELGGSRRIVEDEVCSRILKYHQRKRKNETNSIFASRNLDALPVELTSRVGTSEVAKAKSLLGNRFRMKSAECVDVALATNMISVGLDITRLGLMVVFGQPKTTAEYIQTTSRVGRDSTAAPGLVVTIFNLGKPRDRSHYERFEGFHRSFYRGVEATSVTPFAPRALDKGLPGVLVGLVRHFFENMSSPAGASKIEENRELVNTEIVKTLSERIQSAVYPDTGTQYAESLSANVKMRCDDLLDAWVSIAKELGALRYQKHEGSQGKPLLWGFLDPELEELSKDQRKFRANRSLRDVEPSVNIWVKNRENEDVE